MGDPDRAEDRGDEVTVLRGSSSLCLKPPMSADPLLVPTACPRVADLPELVALLEPDDDAALWDCALGTILPQLDARWASEPRGVRRVYVGLFRVSAWRRPHQTRWILGGGFAAPEGYGRHADEGRDWVVWLTRARESARWMAGPRGEPRGLGRGDYVVRVSIPSRTARHDQAAVAASWRPESPWEGMTRRRGAGGRPRRREHTWYGFRRSPSGWGFTTQQEW